VDNRKVEIDRDTTICGSKLLLRSRGTAISIAPTSHITVLLE
jgi:hypothetical protein